MKKHGPPAAISLAAALVGLGAVAFLNNSAQAQELFSLKEVTVPPVPGIENFIRNKNAAIVLGKALFWDQQAGSDGMACASCHFAAGADNRLKNQLSPGLLAGDHTFQPTASGGAGGPNYTLKPSDFPFHQLADVNDRNSAVLFDTNDVASSSGTFNGPFLNVIPRVGDDCGASPVDEFSVQGKATRKVEPRSTPTTINAALNFRNFWDGRANNVFNGVNPFGRRDPAAKVLAKQPDGSVLAVQVDLRNSSAASQSVGPPLSALEMSCSNKAFKDVGRKLLTLRPLQQQQVISNDSRLGAYRHPSGNGLINTYAQLVKMAFNPKWWSASGSFDGYTQMEANFSLFWGLAIQAYEETLISDEAPIDRFFGHRFDARNPNAGPLEPDPGALTDKQKLGLAVFEGKGFCVNCHRSAEFTGAATRLQPENQENGLVERMIMGDQNESRPALYDNGFYNIGVRPTIEDRGVGGKDPFGNPLSFTRQYIQMLRGQNVPDPFQVDECTFEVQVTLAEAANPPQSVACSKPDQPAEALKPDPDKARVAVDGAFKTSGLRNIGLSQPYFHNGGQGTLEQVVDFYNRGGDRRGQDGDDTTGLIADDAPNGSTSNLDADIRKLELTGEEKEALVDFMRHALTDRRVACEQAPFDHPSLKIPNGHLGNEFAVSDTNGDGKADDEFALVPAVGAGGLPAIGKPCLKNDDGSDVLSAAPQAGSIMLAEVSGLLLAGGAIGFVRRQRRERSK